MVGADAVIALAADIERRDTEVAAAIELVRDLDRRAAEIRARSAELQGLLAAAPGELAALDRREAAARDASAEAATALAGAERRLSDLDASRHVSPQARAEARRGVEQARELIPEAAAQLEGVALEREELVHRTASVRVEAGELVRDARDVVLAIHDVPRVSQSGRDAPGTELAQLVEWSSRVHAALFVVRGQLEGEREQLVREANELGAAVLGEELAGSNVALVRRRLEERLQT